MALWSLRTAIAFQELFPNYFLWGKTSGDLRLACRNTPSPALDSHSAACTAHPFPHLPTTARLSLRAAGANTLNLLNGPTHSLSLCGSQTRPPTGAASRPPPRDFPVAQPKQGRTVPGIGTTPSAAHLKPGRGHWGWRVCVVSTPVLGRAAAPYGAPSPSRSPPLPSSAQSRPRPP